MSNTPKSIAKSIILGILSVVFSWRGAVIMSRVQQASYGQSLTQQVQQEPQHEPFQESEFVESQAEQEFVESESEEPFYEAVYNDRYAASDPSLSGFPPPSPRVLRLMKATGAPDYLTAIRKAAELPLGKYIDYVISGRADAIPPEHRPIVRALLGLPEAQQPPKIHYQIDFGEMPNSFDKSLH